MIVELEFAARADCPTVVMTASTLSLMMVTNTSGCVA